MKRRAGTRGVFRFLGRLAVLGISTVVLTLVGVQFARILNQNVAMARSLSAVQRDVQTLKARKREEQRELRRLSDPEGSVPAIHDRLHLVRPNEAIIFIKRGPH